MEKTDPKVLTEFNKEAIFSLKPATHRARQTALKDSYNSPMMPLDHVSSRKEFTPHEPHSSEEKMKATSKAVAVCMPFALNTYKIVLSICLAFLLLMISFGFAIGQVNALVDEQSNETFEPVESAAAESAATENDGVESVTMSISIEEGGCIDLKPPPPPI
ncbi:MAG: hypothetical protein ABIA59_03095 [Candidatus Latescibacterota bacterium]